MVRPTINGVVSVAQPNKVMLTKDVLTAKLFTDETFKNKVLVNTANRWAKARGFNGDLTLVKIAETGKSVHIAVDGKELTKKYSLCGSGNNMFLVSPSVFWKKN